MICCRRVGDGFVGGVKTWTIVHSVTDPVAGVENVAETLYEPLLGGVKVAEATPPPFVLPITGFIEPPFTPQDTFSPARGDPTNEAVNVIV